MHFPFQNARGMWLFGFKRLVSITLRNGVLHRGIRGVYGMCQERQSPSQSCLLPFHHPDVNTARALCVSETGNVVHYS